MKRLATILPEWTRTMWASEKAKAVWQPRLDHINGAWMRIERWSVIDGARGSCLTFAEPKDLPELVRWASEHGVLVLPMTQVGTLEQYSAAPQPVTVGQAWQYRIVLCRPEFRDAWFQAWQDGTTNDETIGELLGFPKCCRRFFREIWVDQKFLDTSWPMAVNSQAPDQLDTCVIEIPALPLETNILLRWLGVRAVAHLPCSFNCEKTLESAKMFDQVGRARHFSEAVDWTREMLAWPVEWSALHGIAEIKTPILKVSSRTDMTAEKYVVRKLGSGYPDEGSDGLVFPYRTNQKQVQLTKTPAFAQAFDMKVPAIDAVGAVATLKAGAAEIAAAVGHEDLWTDNGFPSHELMDAAHAVLLRVVPKELEAGDAVLDLGCGNGKLLERLGEEVSGLNMYGIELDPERCRRAGERLRSNGNTQILIYEGSMFDQALWTEEHYGLVFFMPGRLLELRDAGTRADTLRGLLLRSRRVIFYAYGDWLRKHDNDIVRLLADAGFGEWRLAKCVRRENVQAVLGKGP